MIIKVQRAKFFALIALIICIFLYHVYYIRQAVHSEGIQMIDEWGTPILGIDFERDKFIYADELTSSKALGKIEIIQSKIYPFLVVRLSNFELPILWKDYHTPTIITIIKFILLKLNIPPKYFPFIYSFSFLFLFASVYIFSAGFFLRRYFSHLVFIVLISFIFLLSSPSFYVTIYQFHHIQACIFLLLFLYFLRKKNYLLAGFSGGLMLISYIPSIFILLGASLFHTIYFRSRETIIKVISTLLISLFLSGGHIFFLFYSASYGNLNQPVYNCSDCIIINFTEDIKIHLGIPVGTEVKRMSIYNIFSVFWQKLIHYALLPVHPSELFRKIVLALNEIKKSMSAVDISIMYGMMTEKTPFYSMANLAIWIHIIILFFGAFFLSSRYELGIYIFCLIFYLLFSEMFMILPKMFNFLLPLYSIISVRVFFRFLEHSRIFSFIFLISGLLRISEIYGMPKKYPPYIREKENREIVEFIEKNNIKENEIVVYSLPIAFRIYSNGKINPPTVFLIFKPLEPLDISKIGGFLADKTRYVVVDIRIKKWIIEGAENKNFKVETLFENSAFSIINFKKQENS